MIRSLLVITFFCIAALSGEELKIVSDTFKSDQQKGISVFSGNVKITKGKDELTATKVTVYTDKDNQPLKYMAEGGITFSIVTEKNEKYSGKSQSAVYLPKEQEYQFYTKVDLIRLDDYRRVKGDKVVVNTTFGYASAESADNEPVVMTFTVKDKNPKSEKQR